MPKREGEPMQEENPDREYEEAKIEGRTERLFQLMKQEGVIKGTNKEYNLVWKYVESGEANEDWEEDFFKKVKGIEDRDKNGEWGEFIAGSGETIPKIDRKEKPEQ